MIEAGETLSNEVVETTLQANHPYLYVPGESTEHWAMYVSGGINIFTEGNEGGEKQTEYDGSDGTFCLEQMELQRHLPAALLERQREP